MAFALTDIEIVVILAVVLIVIYIAGSYWKHRTLKRLAHWFEKRFTGIAKVKYASYGHAGLRIKCEMNDDTSGFREMHFALSLGARENLMYYPLRTIMHIPDRVDCWGTLKVPAPTEMKVMKLGDNKRVAGSEKDGLQDVGLKAIQEAGFAAYASHIIHARELLSRQDLISRLKAWPELELLELNQEPSSVHITARLQQESLNEPLDFLYFMGRLVGG